MSQYIYQIIGVRIEEPWLLGGTTAFIIGLLFFGLGTNGSGLRWLSGLGSLIVIAGVAAMLFSAFQ